MCADFIDLKKACTKDSFPYWELTSDLVDSTAGHELLSFMDAFSGYNQIKMQELDQEKMSFNSDHGQYYYNVIPFRLKNVEATY